MDERDVVVIGGGPAGFMAAQRASLLGGNVMLVEKEKLGGICVNWGCMPMCFMTHCAGVLRLIKEVKKDGINIGEVRVDYTRMMSEKEKVIKGIVTGMEARLKATNVPVVIGSAKLTSPNEVEIESGKEPKKLIRSKKIIIATGSVARRYEIPGAYSAGVLTAKELLDLNEVPRSLAIIGRGVTALELATVWLNLGSAVTVIARKPQFLPGEDEEIAAYLGQVLKADGVQIHAGVNIERIDDSAGGKSVTISAGGTRQKVTAQYVVFALGQRPLVDGLGLENAGIAVTEGGIKINKSMETGVRGIYAAGDATGEMMLANVAMVQGTLAAENAMGRNLTMDYRVVPRFVRTLPPMAAVGITEGEAKESGRDIKVSKFPFEQNPKTGIIREGGGFVKMIADPASGEILGVHIVGPQATELIHEAVMVMQMRGTARGIAVAMHNHPCLHETVQRAAQSLCG